VSERFPVEFFWGRASYYADGGEDCGRDVRAVPRIGETVLIDMEDESTPAFRVADVIHVATADFSRIAVHLKPRKMKGP
jgi:hypothetical protein